jgi:two-component system, chemotaxis family, chemotaxis protein CheY
MKSDDFPNLNTKKPAGIKENGQPYNVIVVEDKSFQKQQIVQILESEGYKIIATASDGKEALTKYHKVIEQQIEVDLLTTTLDMPVLDGYALVYEFNQLTKRPKILFISDETTKGVMEDLIQMKISGFLLKPINRRAILDRIKIILSK